MNCQWEKVLSKERTEETLDPRQKSRGMPGLDPQWQKRGEDRTPWIQEKTGNLKGCVMLKVRCPTFWLQ